MSRRSFRFSWFRSLRNTSASLQSVKPSPAKPQDDVAMRRAMQKQNYQSKIVSRMIDRIRGGSDL